MLDLPLLQSARHEESRTSSQQLSSRSVETSEMRSLRLLRGARVREERMSSARQNVRSLELEWRLNHFRTLEKGWLRGDS